MGSRLLDRRRVCAGARTCIGIEQCLGALAPHDGIGHGVRVSLVGIAHLSDATLELHARALLDHVRGLVSHGVQIGAAEHDVVPRGIGRTRGGSGENSGRKTYEPGFETASAGGGRL